MIVIQTAAFGLSCFLIGVVVGISIAVSIVAYIRHKSRLIRHVRLSVGGAQ